MEHRASPSGMPDPAAYPLGKFAYVGSHCYKIIGHSRYTVDGFNVETGQHMAIRYDIIDEVNDMARPRKTAEEKKKDTVAKVANKLIDAVKFCAPGFNEGGESYSVHAQLYQGWISTYSGVVMYGHKIDAQLTALPHFGLLLAALRTAGDDAVQFTQLDQGRLAIKVKGFRTVVPCMTDWAHVTRPAPDARMYPIDSRMREGFEACKKVTNKRGETLAQSAVLVRNGDMIATDGKMLVQFWHGNGFPELCVPADFVEAVLKVPKSLVGFGYTEGRSVTFYFEDDSFIFSQLYGESYPDVSRAMPPHYEGLDQLPDNFFTALEKLDPFLPKTQTHAILLKDMFSTTEDDDTGTQVECGGLRDIETHGLDVDRVLRLQDLVTHMDYFSDPRVTRFANREGTLRGVVTNFMFEGVSAPDKLPPAPAPDPMAGAFASEMRGEPAPAPQAAPVVQAPPQAASADDWGGWTPPTADVQPGDGEPAPEPAAPAPADAWTLG